MHIAVIKPGVLVRDNLGMILNASSTVTLVVGEGHNMIVDTGLPGEGPEVMQGLAKHGLSCQDIDTVVNTHLHGDHIGNNAMFAQARFVVHANEFPARISEVQVVTGDTQLSQNIRIIETPGHTMGSISVVVRDTERKINYVLAGDALPIRDNYLKWVPPGINYDARIALDSMKKIVSTGDYIVPGHDSMFRVDRDIP
jgi:glyoxylase-like metal-dependent hydrolase (beta-lactamase superfamily II)